MKLESVRDLLVHELRDLYNAENQLASALPRFVDAARQPDLKEALEGRLVKTREHVTTLERIFDTLDEDPSGRKCRGMEGLIDEVEDGLETEAAVELEDLGLMAAVQRLEHYEMASDGTARTHAESLGHHQIADTLQGVLNQEGRAEPRVQPSPRPGLRGSPSSAPSREGASRLRGSGGRSRG